MGHDTHATTAQIPSPKNVCAAYADCRALTAGEKKLGKSYYGAAIDFDSVHIINGRYLGIFPIGDYTGMSPDGNVYVVGKAVRSRDYSRDKEKAHFFIHELFHIKQRNEGLNILGQAFSLHAMGSGNPYQYLLKNGKAFHTYNFEQQARMVEHAYILGENLRSGGKLYAAMTEGVAKDQRCTHWARLKGMLTQVAVTVGALPALCR